MQKLARKMETLLQDIRFGFRQLMKQPGFAALAIVSMALGIGANTSIFSLVDTALLRPLAVKEPSQLVELYGTLHNGADWSLQSYPNYKEYRDRNTVLSGLFVYRVVVSSLTVNNSSQRVWGYLVSGNYFDVLGVKPMLGRAFLPEEDQTPDSHPVAVISYNCWQRRFGGDPAIVGKTVEVNSRPFTIIGVAPKGFIGTEVAYDPEMFVPVMMANTIEPGSRWLDKRDSNDLFTVGRLKPGVSFAQAKAALETLAAKLAQDYPENVGRGIRLGKPGLFIPEIANSVFAFTGVLAAVGALVLLLACVNLASLLLARATDRRREIAVRLAIGATRRRLVRQLLTESLLISLGGGAAGIFLAAAINSAVRGTLAERHYFALRSAHRLARSHLRAAALDRDGNSFQSRSGAAIIEAAARARVERGIVDGWLPSLAFAQLPRCRASQPLVGPSRQRRSNCAQSASRPEDASRVQSGKRGRDFVRRQLARL